VNQWVEHPKGHWTLGQYLVSFDIKEYSVWLKGKKCLGRSQSLLEAQLLASVHQAKKAK